MSEEVRCPSCKMRHRVPPPDATEFYNPWPVSPQSFKWIENAARVFDRESDELFTASDFVAWIRPDCVGRDAA